MDDDDGDEIEEIEEIDPMDALGSLLATEEGETIATALVGAKDALENIAEAMTLQNKILVKILASISNQKCACKTECGIAATA